MNLPHAEYQDERTGVFRHINFKTLLNNLIVRSPVDGIRHFLAFFIFCFFYSELLKQALSLSKPKPPKPTRYHSQLYYYFVLTLIRCYVQHQTATKRTKPATNSGENELSWGL
jgi:hypothetical protein